jgi:hypothetical protein
MKIQSKIKSNSILHDMEMAIGIAEGSNQYAEYTDGGRWLDEQMLYDWLNRDTTIRYSSSILDSFYLANANGDLEKLWMVDDLIAQLTDSVNMENTSYWTGLLQTAYTENNNIQSSEVFTINEKWVNNKYLNYLDVGLGNISQEDFEDLETMANACPYIDGTAVFKARTLYAMFVPGIDYDDMSICNSIGVFKGGKSLYEIENEMLLVNNEDSKFKVTDYVKVYPNPATNQINLAVYLKDGEIGEFILYDLLGNKLQANTISKTITNIELNGLRAGLYIYKYMCSNKENYTGKLIIE